MPKQTKDERRTTHELVKQIKRHREAQYDMGYGNQHDVQHNQNGQLLDAAVSYIKLSQHQVRTRNDWSEDSRERALSRDRPMLIPTGGTMAGYDVNHTAPSEWPWAREHFNPSDPRYNLIRAGALIVAELERLDYNDRKAVGSNARPTGKKRKGQYKEMAKDVNWRSAGIPAYMGTTSGTNYVSPPVWGTDSATVLNFTVNDYTQVDSPLVLSP